MRRTVMAPMMLMLVISMVLAPVFSTPAAPTTAPTAQTAPTAPISSHSSHTDEVTAEEFDFGIILLCSVVILSFVINTVTHGHWFFKKIPEGGLTIIIGFFVSLLDFAGGGNMERVLALDTKVFQLFLLPPIIFDAGFSLRKRGLFDNIGTIMGYAVVGTLISTLLVGVVVYHYIKYTREPGQAAPNVFECGMFGALISAVDPIASLAVFSSVFKISANARGEEQKETPLLYNLVFGESVLNDAVSIVVYKAFQNSYINNEVFSPQSVFNLTGRFFSVFFASLGIGIAFGLFTSFLFKHTNKRGNITYELFIIFFLSYCSFVISEVLHFSGIVAIFFCGILQSHYTWYNLSPGGSIILPKMYHSIACVMETLIFAYLGMAVFAFHSKHNWNFTFIMAVLAICFGARALGTGVLSAVANLGRKRKISWKKQIIIWFSGLRGAIAFALAVDMKAVKVVGKTGTPYSNQFISTTLAIVFITTFVCGGLTGPLLQCLDLTTEEEIPKDRQKGRSVKSYKHHLTYFDKHYMKRWLTNPVNSNREQLKRARSAFEATIGANSSIAAELIGSIITQPAEKGRRSYKFLNENPLANFQSSLSSCPEIDGLPGTRATSQTQVQVQTEAKQQESFVGSAPAKTSSVLQGMDSVSNGSVLVVTQDDI